MTNVLLLVAVLVAGLACPAMMWFNHKRGRKSPCCPPSRNAGTELDRLKAERAAVEDQLAALQGTDRPLAR
jgi:hypothetical protein